MVLIFSKIFEKLSYGMLYLFFFAGKDWRFENFCILRHWVINSLYRWL